MLITLVIYKFVEVAMFKNKRGLFIKLSLKNVILN